MKKSETINLRVDNTTKAEFQKKADEVGMSLTDYILSAVRNSRVVVLKEGPEICANIMNMRNAVAKNGITPEFEDMMRELILKIDALIDSFPQNIPEPDEDFCEDNIEDDDVDEVFDFVEGDII